MAEGAFNPFRVVGDLSHLVSFVFLMLSIHKSYDASVISSRTQQLLLCVFLCRYMDVYRTFWDAPYLVFMKIMFIMSTFVIVIQLRKKRRHISEDFDLVPRLALLVPCMISAAIYQHHVPPHTIQELLWTFSILLESVALIPQLYLLHKETFVYAYMAHYLALLVLYRFMYCVNWVVRWTYFNHSTPLLVCLAGIVQNILLVDFVYYYLLSRKKNGLNADLSLPS